MKKVGKCLLSEILKQRKMSQQDLADRLGVTRQQINSYCKNKRRMSLSVAINISSILECEIQELYEITD